MLPLIHPFFVMLDLLKTVSMKLLSVKFTANEPPEIKKIIIMNGHLMVLTSLVFQFSKVTTNIDNVK